MLGPLFLFRATERPDRMGTKNASFDVDGTTVDGGRL